MTVSDGDDVFADDGVWISNSTDRATVAPLLVEDYPYVPPIGCLVRRGNLVGDVDGHHGPSYDVVCNALDRADTGVSSIAGVARELGCSRKTVTKCINNSRRREIYNLD